VIVCPYVIDDTYIYKKNFSTYDSELIKVHFRNLFRGVDQNFATVDHIWQVYDSDHSLVIKNNSTKILFSIEKSLKLDCGYELAIASLSTDGNKAYVELSRNGIVVDNAVIVCPYVVDDTYIYKKNFSTYDSELIKVHFRNLFRGYDSNFATVDHILQVSDSDSSLIIKNNSTKILFSIEKSLKLDGGYELAIVSLGIDGDKAYVVLSRNGVVVDSAVIVCPYVVDDTYIYPKNLSTHDSELIKVHFRNFFGGIDWNLATVDHILQVSDSDSSCVLQNNHTEITIWSGNPLKLEDGYDLAILSIDLNGNKAHVELSRNGMIVDNAIIGLNGRQNRLERAKNFKPS